MDQELIKKNISGVKSLEVIDQGGQKTVYRAGIKNQIVALKVIKLTSSDDDNNLVLDDDALKRAQREINIGNVDSEHLVKMVNKINPILIKDDKEAYFCYAEEFVDGDNLKEIMASIDKSKKHEIIKKLLSETCKALENLKSAGYLHRDIKPANIMLDKVDNKFKLIDTGIAYALNESSLTPKGITVGSLPYIAPERFDGIKKDPRSDIYSLGIIAYEIANGGHPYYNSSLDKSEIIKRILIYNPPDLSEADTLVESDLLQVIKRMINKKPHRRYKSSAYIGETLSKI